MVNSDKFNGIDSEEAISASPIGLWKTVGAKKLLVIV